MKNSRRTISSLLVGFLFLAGPLWTAEESALDRLPIGSSSQRLALAALEAGRLMDTASGRETTVADLVRSHLDRDVYIIGEIHDSFACHVWQKEFIEALAQVHPRLVVGFEFFNRADDPALARYLEGAISEAELLEKTGWYRRGAQNFAYTRLVLETAGKLGLKAVGLNVPRELIRRVARSGTAGLSAGEKALFPGVERGDPQHEFFIRSTLGDFAVQVPMWFRGIYAAQKCWDTVMAESMRRALERPNLRGYKGVIIAGSAHVAYGLGIPWRYRRAQDRARILTLVPVQVAAEKNESGTEENPMVSALAGQLQPAAVFSRGLADAVFAVPAEKNPHFAEAGFSGKINGEGFFEIERVDRETPAERQGLKNGDLILSVDGVPVQSLEGLRLLLAGKNWGDSLFLEIRKRIALSPEIEKR